MPKALTVWITINCGKLSSDQRTGKGQFSFQSQRRAVPKNVQTTIQLPLFCMLVRLCSKSFKLDFSSRWTENFKIYKLGLEDRGTRYQIANICWITEKDNILKNLLLLHWLHKSLWLCGSQQTGKFWEMGVPDHLICLLRNLYVGQEATVRTGHGTNWLVPNLERSMTRLYIVTRLI